MSGIVHSYYAVAMAPAIGALVGAGALELWRAKARGGRVGAAAAITLGATVAGTALLAAVLLWRSPEFMPWLAPVVMAGGLLAGVALAVPNLPRPAVAVAAAVGLARHAGRPHRVLDRDGQCPSHRWRSAGGAVPDQHFGGSRLRWARTLWWS